jgi:hypothetical protein
MRKIFKQDEKTNIYQIFSSYIYIHLNILCIALTGNKILCLNKNFCLSFSYHK